MIIGLKGWDHSNPVIFLAILGSMLAWRSYSVVGTSPTYHSLGSGSCQFQSSFINETTWIPNGGSFGCKFFGNFSAT